MTIEISRNPNHRKRYAAYQPKAFLRGGARQTLLSRLLSADDLVVNEGEQALILDGGEDKTGMDTERNVRLLGYYTAHKSQGPRRGLVMTIHGWEGCSHSAYNLVVGSALVRAGFDVLRLNLRDHGPSHSLNRGLFYVTLIEEALAAAGQVGQMAGGDPFYIFGASMGGNFALRLALAHSHTPIHNLSGVVAINPVLNPSRSSDLLDHHAWIRLYFRQRWLESLRTKQRLFPDSYDFSPVERIPTIRGMTDWMLRRYSPFTDTESYFRSYALSPRHFEALTVPTTILTAADDPIIPADEFYRLPYHPLLSVHVLPSGGHVGYTDLFPLRHFLTPMVLQMIGA